MQAVNEELNPVRHRNYWIQLWPLGAYCFSMVAVVFALEWSEYYFRWPSTIYASLISGFVIGQGSWLALVAGLWGRCWLIGLASASLLAAMLTVAFMLSEGSGQSWSDLLANMWGLWMIPLIVLGISSPILALRFGWGWQLSHASNTRPLRRTPLGVEEMMLGVTSVAALLFLTRIPQTMWQLPMHVFVANIGMAFALLATISLLSALPLFLCFVHFHSLWSRWLFPWLAGCILTATIFGSFEAIALGDISSIDWMPAGITGLMAGSIYTLGLVSLAQSGYRVVKSTAWKSLIPDDEANFEREVAVQRREHRYWVGATLAVSMLSSFALVGLSYSRQRLNQQLANIAAELQAAGGAIVTRERRIEVLSVGKQATDQSLEEYSQHKSVTELSLANSHVTDAGLARLATLFPKLKSLDLSGTKITSAGLKNLLKLRSLSSLSLAGTELEIAAINQFICDPARRSRDTQIQFTGSESYKLDLSNMAIDEEKLAQLEPSVARLVLRNNGITDASLGALRRRTFAELDISENSISGSGLVPFQIQSLVARDVPLTDAALGKIVAGGTLNKLVVSNTQLTDAILPALSGSINYLVLGEGQFTDAGIENAGRMSCHYLGLNGRQFTGTCLSKLPGSVQSLDLSGSGITDENLARLSDRHLSCLDLSDTSITDRGLQALDEGQIINMLNLSGTQITARGLANCRLRNCKIYLNYNQFTPNELRSLQELRNIIVGESFPSSW